MKRIALGIEYDGAPFQGWQSQPHGNTLQDALECALAKVAGTPLRLTCAGRTDAGVHALAQVAHFDSPVERPEQAWIRGANAHLPDSIAVRWAQPVAADFHARFSALSRSYRYLLHSHAVRPALNHDRIGWCHRPLSVDAMREAAQFLLGEQDFSAFRASECQAKSPRKTLYQADVVRQGELIIFDFRATAFLQHMVRNIVGALIYVGKGKHPPAWIAELLASRKRTLAAPTISAAGLYFAGVEYPPQYGLPNTPNNTALI
ncbi:MAG: tRNA pseudouridine(38-40) synthase TruA [Betaproteobacteria bacterium]|nr:tRNA pseudouridine(38-40) synthase TruA [Betaproteobacteria bacterium]